MKRRPVKSSLRLSAEDHYRIAQAIQNFISRHAAALPAEELVHYERLLTLSLGAFERARPREEQLWRERQSKSR